MGGQRPTGLQLVTKDDVEIIGMQADHESKVIKIDIMIMMTVIIHYIVAVRVSPRTMPVLVPV
jgi:hypothetical protein